ncbi:hypothetical protein L1856_09900 [Streptomyces sp. Tue 6430]|nr:hypothetical protein [Streptomyces sp. Tue 6430]
MYRCTGRCSALIPTFAWFRHPCLPAKTGARPSSATLGSDLRRASGHPHTHDARLTELIRFPGAGDRALARLRASGTVAAHRENRKTVGHPTTGRVEVDCDVLTYGDCGLEVVILTASPGSPAEDRLRLALSADSGSKPTPLPDPPSAVDSHSSTADNPQSPVARRQSAVGSRQSAVGSRQSAVGSRSSPSRIRSSRRDAHGT